MASHEYHHGEMDVSQNEATWNGFLRGVLWGSLIIGLMIGYATLALAIPMNWMIALGIMAVVGFVAGMLMNMGGRWYATLVLLIILAVVLRVMIALFGALT